MVMVLPFLVRSKPNVSYGLAGLAAREHVNSRNLQWLGSVTCLPRGDGSRPLYLRAGAPRIGGLPFVRVGRVAFPALSVRRRDAR